MTTLQTPDIPGTTDSDLEYMEFPLEASSITAESASYGIHLVPLDAAGDYDLPLLLPQTVNPADLPAPDAWQKWGRVNRSSSAAAWHHYCTDAKFTTLLRDPKKLIDTGAKFTTEVNVSSYQLDPLPVTLAGLWRKRCVSRIWQDHGVAVAVDMHVSGLARELVFDGVDRNHNFFCTRYKARDLSGDYLGIEAVIDDYDLVLDFVGEDVKPTFVVYGVPASLTAECQERGWIVLPNAAPATKTEKN